MLANEKKKFCALNFCFLGNCQHLECYWPRKSVETDFGRCLLGAEQFEIVGGGWSSKVLLMGATKLYLKIM